MNICAMSERKVNALAKICLLIGFVILYYTNLWWPGILLGFWVYFAIKQYCMKKYFDFVFSSIFLIGLFVIAFFELQIEMYLPILLVGGGICLILKEYFDEGKRQIESAPTKDDPNEKEEPKKE